MSSNVIGVTIASLLHDIGKVLYRTGSKTNHSELGYDYLKDTIKLSDKDILDSVLYHHSSKLKNSTLAESSMAYIVYLADNIASGIDRRKYGETESDIFKKSTPLYTIFNILNENNENLHYSQKTVNLDEGINMPTSKEISLDNNFYDRVMLDVSDSLKNINYSSEYVNSLLNVLEANLSYIPSSTNISELIDISLYDHLKMTAAIASSILLYLEEKGVLDYKKRLYTNSESFYSDKAFLMYEVDLSGIQKFIYTISSKGALKGLRSRSFYLELLMEHIIDELLEKVNLSRSNLISSGGGRASFIFPNTEGIKNKIMLFEKEVNSWFIENFDIGLYLAGGYVECSSNDLQNKPNGSISNLHIDISKNISMKKGNRYSAEDIVRLNNRNNIGKRECVVCKKMDIMDDDSDKCCVCSDLEYFSDGILYGKYYVITKTSQLHSLILPFGKYLTPYFDKKDIIDIMNQEDYCRTYTKNRHHTGSQVSNNLWVGDYTLGKTFKELSEKSIGIDRIAILRADVDNLGNAFINGLSREGGKYDTISRKATLSRQLSLYFKGYINNVLKNGVYDVFGKKGERNVSIVYSGGDDIFLVGAWDEIISAAVDIRESFKKFSQNTLSISAGIGIYKPNYPINMIAKEVEKLESVSKNNTLKDSITLFSPEHCYKWDDLVNNVLGEKYLELKQFFSDNTSFLEKGEVNERGKAFLYNLLDLLRNVNEKINIARYVYLLSRMEPKDPVEKGRYLRFSGKMYEWMTDEKDRKELITAIYIFVYSIRERK